MRGASRLVAVVLTQDWCGQWAAMDGYLAEMGSRHPELELTVFLLEYNRVDYFQEFLSFKEQVLGNRRHPLRALLPGRVAGRAEQLRLRAAVPFLLPGNLGKSLKFCCFLTPDVPTIEL